MRYIEKDWERILIGVALAAGLMLLVALRWVWEQLDATGHTLLLLGAGVALYGFGWFMDRITGRSANGKRR
jgi:hypothetical protein